MSDITLITHCPHCDTSFRIYEHQLERRSGQVRCGACGNVFDAYVDLETRVEPQSLASPGGMPPLPGTRAPARADAYKADKPEKPENRRDRPTPAPPPAVEHPAAAPVALETPAVAPPPPAFSLDTEIPDTADVPEVLSTDYLTQDGSDYNFGPGQANARAHRRLVIGASVLGFVLGLQALLWFRAELAGYAPGTRPLLTALCTVLGCTVGLPTNADRIVIESTELQAERPGLLVLAGTLRNNAGYAQAFPSVELTLTDSREQPIVRRVLAPREYLDESNAARPGVPAGGEIPVRAVIDAAQINASGYRVYVFYPGASTPK